MDIGFLMAMYAEILTKIVPLPCKSLGNQRMQIERSTLSRHVLRLGTRSYYLKPVRNLLVTRGSRYGPAGSIKSQSAGQQMKVVAHVGLCRTSGFQRKSLIGFIGLSIKETRAL